VALLFEAPNAYSRGVLVGIGDYILSHGPWHVHLAEIGRDSPPPRWLSTWVGQGIIARFETRRVAEAAARLKLPMVDATPSRLLNSAPWVKSDDAAVARLAADHFLERGFRNFAFCGDPRYAVSARREEFFRIAVRGRGHACVSFAPPPRPGNDDAVTDAVGRWLGALPKPVAVFAYNDSRGQQVLDGCRRAGLPVPDAVAVLGVDNDEVLCALSPPPMSSVILNPRRAGWEAAALLSLMMQGEHVPPSAHFIPPLGIATRQSTDILAVNDSHVASALRYIREHACEGIGVGDVLRHCPMARRALETRFKRLIGRTPRQEIVRVQLNRAKELLVGSDLTMADIAERVGFETAYLSTVFKQETGMTASDYRRQYGRGR
jgi:LacI family transcriptional regulator